MKKKIIISAAVILGLAAVIYGLLAQQAYQQASSFQPEGMCGQSITKARHDLTGVTSEFTSTCIPGGWSAVR